MDSVLYHQRTVPNHQKHQTIEMYSFIFWHSHCVIKPTECVFWSITMDKKITPTTRRRLTVPALAVVLLAGTAWFGSTWQASAQMSLALPLSSVSTAIVQQQSLQESIALRANVMPQQTVFLDVIEGVRVEEKLIEQGQFVTHGQPLVKLSNTALQLDLISREAQVTEQMNFLRNTQMTIETNRLNLKRDVLDIEHQLVTLKRNLAQTEPLVKS